MAAQREMILSAVLTADISKFQKNLEKATKKAQDIGKELQDVGKKMSTYLTLPLAAAGGLAVANAVKFEKLATSLNVLAGSAEEGAKAFERIKQFSAATPFQLDELVNVNNTLMGFGLSGDAAFDSLKRLSDMAAVSGSDLNRLAIAYGQSAAMGRVMTMDLTQFVNNGVPVFKLLGDITGKNAGELRHMAETGQITFEMLQQAFQKATDSGGIFFEGTAKLSQTLGGRLSTLRDNFNLMMGDIGQLIGDFLSPLIDTATSVFKSFNQLSDTTKKWIVIIGGIVAAIGPLLVAFGSIQMIMPLIIGGFTTLGVVINALFSPITLIVAGIGGLIAAFIYLRDNSEVTFAHLRNGWVYVKNAFISGVQLILAPLEVFAEALTRLANLIGIDMVNPMKGLVSSLNNVKDEIIPVTQEFGSFGDALKNTAMDLGILKKEADNAESAISNLNKTVTNANGSSKINAGALGGISGTTLSGGDGMQITAIAGNLDKAKDSFDEYNKSLKAAELSTAALGVVTDGTASSIIHSLGMIAGQSKGFALFEIAANTAIGLAKAVQAGAGIPFPANLGAIAAGTSAVLSGIAGAKQVLNTAPAFATGGIVGGSSFYGDKVLARVNSGEMILNSGQQSRLFSMINNGGASGSVNVIGKLKGADIWLSNERSGMQRRRYTGR